MSRHGEVTINCWDGTYTFRLAWGEIIKIQEACDAGAYHVADRLIDGVNLYAQYIREPLRIGLIGGGMSQMDALKTVQTHVEPHLDENRGLAWYVIRLALAGTADESLGKALEAVTEMKASGFREEKSPSPNSTAPAP